MNKKGETLSKVEILILTLALCLGTSLIFFLAYPSLLSKKISLPSQIPTISFEPEKKIHSTPDEFMDIVSQLNSSQKLLNYLKENFILEEKDVFFSLSPREIFERKKGNSFELAIFTSYVLWYHGHEVSIIKYKTDKGRENTVIVFRDRDLPKTIIFNQSEPLFYPHGWSFEEMFKKEEEKLREEIKEHSLFYWSDSGKLLPEKEEWIKRAK